MSVARCNGVSQIRSPIAIIALNVGCGSGADAQPNPLATSSLPRESPALTDSEKADLSTSLSGFAFALWQDVRREPATANNYAISPTSVSLALGMAYAGDAPSSSASTTAPPPPGCSLGHVTDPS